MAVNKILRILLCVLLLVPSFLAAQEAGSPETAPPQEAGAADPAAGEIPADVPPTADVPATPEQTAEQQSGYYFVETEEGIRFIQRIEWELIDYVLRYVITVERRMSPEGAPVPVYVEILRESVEENFIEISIPPGDYRYRVAVYNFLDRLDGESDWEEFNVFLAVQPFLENFSPRNFYLDEDQSRRMTLSGEKFVEGSEVFLIPQESLVEASFLDRLRNRAAASRIVPAEVELDEDGTSIELLFDESDLIVGHYDIWVQNPGGLFSTLGPLNIAFQKPVDLNVSLGYSPLVMFYGSLLKEELDRMVNFGPFYPMGLSARITFIPIKQVFGYFGIELEPFWGYVNNPVDRYEEGSHIRYDIKTHVLGGHLNVVYQKPLIAKKLVLNARLGGGIHSFLDMHFAYDNDVTAPAMDTWFVSIGGGVSVQWFVYKRLFVDVGIEYKHFFAQGMPVGFLFPGLHVGWQF